MKNLNEFNFEKNNIYQFINCLKCVITFKSDDEKTVLLNMPLILKKHM